VTYLFEDYWPLLGDYDMNDVVLNVKPDYLLNVSNQVESLNLEVTLRAVGGIKRLAVGLQIDGMARNMVAQVTRNNTSGIDNSVFAASGGLETGQDYAVIPLFDDVHKALGIPAGTMINTTEGGGAGTVAPLRVTFSIYFTTPVDMETVAIDKLNPFIVNGGYENKRDEVHMSGFAPTNKADTRKFGTGDDASDIRYYTSRANMIWALAIPDSIPYPKENFSIKMAYPQIESWATSAGESAKDWYLYPEQSFIYGL
jgi:LruC domain-containing protein